MRTVMLSTTTDLPSASFETDSRLLDVICSPNTAPPHAASLPTRARLLTASLDSFQVPSLSVDTLRCACSLCTVLNFEEPPAACRAPDGLPSFGAGATGAAASGPCDAGAFW